MKIVITGVKSSGKSTVGMLLAGCLGLPFIDLDDIVLKLYREKYPGAESCAEIYQSAGESEFRRLERTAILEVVQRDWCIVATGGSTLLDSESRRQLRTGSIWVYLDAAPTFLWQRLSDKKLPSFLVATPDPQAVFFKRVTLVREVLAPLSDCLVRIENKRPGEIVEDIIVQMDVHRPMAW